MPEKDPSLSIDQRVDEFKRLLGNIMRGLTVLSNDTLPPGLPTPVKPTTSHSEKGIQSDESD